MYKKHIIRACMGFAIIYLLYRNILFSVAGAAVFILHGMISRKETKRERDAAITDRFLDFLICLEPLMKTSGTFMQSFTEAVSDYGQIHGNDAIYNWLDIAVKEFRVNSPTSDVLQNMAKKMDIKDACLFAGSIAVCESTGGNIVEITRKTSDLLAGKIRINREINIILSGKRFEQKVITIMPFALLLLFSFTANSYLNPLYESVAGRFAMSAAGLLFFAEWFFCKRIMDIEV